MLCTETKLSSDNVIILQVGRRWSLVLETVTTVMMKMKLMMWASHSRTDVLGRCSCNSASWYACSSRCCCWVWISEMCSKNWQHNNSLFCVWSPHSLKQTDQQLSQVTTGKHEKREVVARTGAATF